MLGHGDNTKPIAYIDIRVFSHATEDSEKVRKAATNLLPDEARPIISFQKENLTGHHGNLILLLSTRLEDKKLLPEALSKIGSQLNSMDKEELCENLKLHLDRGNLYLRFNKQSAFLGQFSFSQNDPIHMKIHFKNKSSGEITELCKNSGLLP